MHHAVLPSTGNIFNKSNTVTPTQAHFTLLPVEKVINILVLSGSRQ
jgi:hypothetical protein